MNRPDVNRTLSVLKDFQRDTVEHVFARMYDGPNPSTRYLVADEVGLGKTMVARGIVAKTIDRLWDSVDRIDIVYICSNSGIARQNINRLNVTGTQDHRLPDRITLLPRDVKSLRNNKVNFVSFTPGTSFNLGSGQGKADERALLYWLLPESWISNRAGAISVLTGWSARDRFQTRVDSFSQSYGVDETLRRSFRESLDSADQKTLDPSQSLKSRFLRLADQLGRRAQLTDDEVVERTSIVGALRGALAAKCIESLEPDLVILDEFQRFRELLRGGDEAAELARQLFSYKDARVLLLSATPYKMFTLGDETSGDDHYADFVETVAFLQQDPARNAVFKDALRSYRQELFRMGWDDGSALLSARDAVTDELRKVMVRTERLAVTPDRSGMLQECPASMTLGDADVRSFLSLQRVARVLGHQDVMEYWKSAPYLLNFMDDYQFKESFNEATEVPIRNKALGQALRHADSLFLSATDIDAYRRIDPANARLRTLEADTIGRSMWKLLWLPPSMPYYQSAGAFAEVPATLTKRLVFSAWQVVPKVVSALLSYEAERLMMAIGDTGDPGSHSGDSRRTKGQLLRFSISEGRLAGMPVLSLLYPCLTLASEIDPLHSKAHTASAPDLTTVRNMARRKCAELLEAISREANAGPEPDERWYWAAPLLLDCHFRARETADWFGQANLAARWRGLELDVDSVDPDADLDSDRAWTEHVELARRVAKGQEQLGPIPTDLSDVLADLALAGPAVCALRAIGRVIGSPVRVANPAVRNAAGAVAEGLRGLFNQPDVTLMLRRDDAKTAYWRHVLDYGAQGCVQAVLDEYAHVLVEWCGLSTRPWQERAAAIAKEMASALTFRTATVSTDVIDRETSTGEVGIGEKLRLRTRFAVRYGSRQKDDPAQAERESDLRRSFNSPFWPFVLCSTSVGQEGLDFHLYCHAVVHWNLPSNPVDLEQREGRVHRFKGHAVRKNVAKQFGATLTSANAAPSADPWSRLFRMAQDARAVGESDLVPFWVYSVDGGSRIERHVPALPLSRDTTKADQLRRSSAVYRMAFGQSRQEDMVTYLLGKVEPTEMSAVSAKLRIDLSPDRSPNQYPRVTAEFIEDDMLDEVSTQTAGFGVSLHALESLLDDFSTKRPTPPAPVTVAMLQDLLSTFSTTLKAEAAKETT